MASTSLFTAAHAAAKAVHKAGDDYKATFGRAYRDLQQPGAAERIVADIRRRANPLLLSDSPRFAMLRHLAGIVEDFSTGRAA
ncbi:hypothetical protein [Aureimonas sp. AU40]|uniref:hypothetical protein n=1 Tax=Aureimonas sp. AU40 TaxID=1637747 RepID=UPI00078363EE|nr:hypothetical protein [Aureimonas sp. AU40]